MALLFPPGFRVADANWNPLSGAKVRVYTANTTTLSSLFSDSGLSSAISNPVITDAAGYPANGGNECAVQVAAGTYDVALLDSSDNVLASWDDVVPWGSESGDIERTVTGNGRFKVTGSAGAVLVQMGDPSPDNTGGTATFEGQAGTQLDSLTLDAASLNAGTTTGALKENSKKLIGHVSTEATQVTGASSVDIELTNSPTGTVAWDVEIWDYSQSGNGNLQARLSYDGGSTYKAGATDYVGYYEYYDTTGGAYAATALITAAQAQLNANLNGAAGQLGRIRIRIITPNSGTTHTIIDSDSRGVLNTGAHSHFESQHFGAGGYGRASNLRLLMSANNFTFKYRVTPLRGFGEA